MTWIKCAEQQPPINQSVLVVCRQKLDEHHIEFNITPPFFITTGFFLGKAGERTKGFWDWNFDHLPDEDPDDYDFLYWQPLPELPKELLATGSQNS